MQEDEAETECLRLIVKMKNVDKKYYMFVSETTYCTSRSQDKVLLFKFRSEVTYILAVYWLHCGC